MSRDIFRQFIVIVSTAAVISLNILANALPLNGLNTGEISDRFEVYFVPAGYVFSIWGLIYIGLLAYTVYQALPSQRENPSLRRIGYWYVLSCVANIVWLFLWHYEVFSLTLVAMLGLLASLIVIYLRLGVGQAAVSTTERWTVHVPFSIYLGWITVATIANVTQTLDFFNWGGWGISPESWLVIMLAAAVAITAAVLYTRRDIAYALVIVWAVVGIAVKFPQVTAVSLAAWIAAGLVAVLILASIFLPRRSSPRPLPA
jgi:hypothetical protein